MTQKIKGTNEGFKTEDLVEEYLNNKIINDLKQTNIKKFILSICSENRIKIKKDTVIKVKNFKIRNSKILGQPKTDKKKMFVAVQVRFVEEFNTPISLEKIKKTKAISHLPLIKQSRLSVMPIDYKSWNIIYNMGKIREI